jgi:hypothetical protein
MGEQHDRAALAASGKPRPGGGASDFRVVGRGFDQARLEPQLVGDADQQLGERTLIAGRVDRRDPDRGTEQGRSRAAEILLGIDAFIGS